MSDANITITENDICKTIICNPTIGCGGNYLRVTVFKDSEETNVQVMNPEDPEDEGLAMDMTRAEAAAVAETLLEAVREEEEA